MREDQEALLCKSLEYPLGGLLGVEHTAAADHGVGLVCIACGAPAQHGRVDGARTDARHAHALPGVGEGQPLGEPDGGVLGGRIHAVAGRGEDAGHRGSRDEVPVAALDPFGQQRAGGIDVRHDVDLPLAVPGLVGRVGTAAVGDACVGEPHVDRADTVVQLLDERLRGLLVGHVEHACMDVLGAELLAEPLHALAVSVCGDHAARAALHERPYERPADAARGACDDDGPAFGVHAAGPYPRQVDLRTADKQCLRPAMRSPTRSCTRCAVSVAA